jgi:hypothetical protein
MASARRPCSASRTTSLPARAEPERGEGPIRVPSSTGTPLVQRALRACRGRFGSQSVTYASGNNTDPPMRLDVARARGMPSYACAVNNLVVQWKHMPLARHPGFRLSWIVHTAPYGLAGNRVSRGVEEPRPIILNRGD